MDCVRSLIFAFLIGLGGANMMTRPTEALAQATSPGGGPAMPSKAAHASAGLVFAISSVRINSRGQLVIQYAVQNTTKFRQYLMLFGSGNASTDSGLTGSVNVLAISGLAHCFMQSGFDESMLRACKSSDDGFRNPNGGGSNIENYSYIEPGDVAVASISYNFDNSVELAHANAAHFVFKALVRTARGGDDALSEAESAKAVGPARVVNINFPFVPIDGAE